MYTHTCNAAKIIEIIKFFIFDYNKMLILNIFINEHDLKHVCYRTSG